MLGRCLSAIGVVGVCVSMFGCGGNGAPPRSSDSSLTRISMSAGADGRIAQLGFLEGEWIGKEGSESSEDIWSAPCGRTMVGTFRAVRADGSLGLQELMSIVADEQGVLMRIRHFDGAMTPWKTEEAGPIVLRLENTVRELGPMGADRGAATPPGTIAEAVFKKVSGSASLDAITYRRQGDTLWSEVLFTRESGRAPLRFEMKRVR